jgi:hypothetical protein
MRYFDAHWPFLNRQAVRGVFLRRSPAVRVRVVGLDEAILLPRDVR